MALNYVKRLQRLSTELEKIATAMAKEKSSSKTMKATGGRSSSVRIRRSRKDAAELKKLLKKDRKAGVPVAELAKKHGISAAYIYMMK